MAFQIVGAAMNVTLKEAQEQLPQLLDRVTRGEQITITREGKPAIKLSVTQIPHTEDENAGKKSWAEVFAMIEPIRRGKNVDPALIEQIRKVRPGNPARRKRSKN